jgi:hypothetical protein
MAKLTLTQLRALVPPDGWEWVKHPGLTTTGSLRRVGPYGEADIPKALKQLSTWAAKNSVGLVGETCTAVPAGGGHYTINVFNTFNAKANATTSTIKAQWGNTICMDCYREKPLGQLTCDTCRYPAYCPNCNRAGHRVQYLPQTPEEATNKKARIRRILGCAACLKVCVSSGCSNLVGPGVVSKKCRVCDPTHFCEACAIEHPARECKAIGKNVEGKNTRWACKKCFDRYSCPECQRFDMGMKLVSRDGKSMCPVCAESVDDEKRKKHEVFSKDELPVEGSLRVISLPERPFRTISIETEVDGDGPYLARALYRCGLIEKPYVEGYNVHVHAESPFPAFLKHDGTVTGGELITFLLNLDEKSHADVLLEILAKLRGLRETGKVDFSASCGGHIHVDAHNYTYSDGWRLGSIFGYLEDPIFRLAGAGSSHGHRSLDKRHQDRAAGHQEGGWTKPIVKGPFGTQGTWGLRIEQLGRGHALNFKPFFQARELCQCGDYRYQAGDKCRCNLGKATIEWRVWNSTGNPRILHAWIAFMQAVHAYAQQATSMTEAEEKLYPELSWERKLWSTLSEPFHQQQKERLEWIFTRLPLTPGERDSLVYALKQSDFRNFGDEYLNGLLKLEGEGALAAKKPARNPNRRKRTLTVKLPEPGSVPVDAPLGVPPGSRRLTTAQRREHERLVREMNLRPADRIRVRR